MKKQFKALANPARIEILKVLSGSKNGASRTSQSATGEVSVRTIVKNVPLAPSTISHHLNVLKDAGIVSARKERQWIYYSINREAIERMREFLSSI